MGVPRILVSVVMPTTGRPERAEACVKRLLQTTNGYPIEVICVVDADEETKRRLEEIGFPVRVNYSQVYRGLPQAWNIGLRETRGGYIVFAADDLWWGDNWLGEALSVMRERFDCEGGDGGFQRHPHRRPPERHPLHRLTAVHHRPPGGLPCL